MQPTIGGGQYDYDAGLVSASFYQAKKYPGPVTFGYRARQ